MYDYANDNSIPEESRKNMDLPKIENAVRDILEAIGEDPNREGLLETPQRVARMYAEVFAGLHRDINKDIKVFNGEGNDEMILIGDIPFYPRKGTCCLYPERRQDLRSFQGCKDRRYAFKKAPAPGEAHIRDR